MSLLPLYLVACALLVVAGAAKLVAPSSNAVALQRLFTFLGPVGARRSVRSFAAVEVALGTMGALVPHRLLASLVCVVYAGFALFLIYLRRRHGSLATCGCLSAPDAPATKMHVAVDLALAAGAAVVARAGSPSFIWQALARQPLDGVPLLAASACCTWLVILTVSALPRLTEARRLVEEGPTR